MIEPKFYVTRDAWRMGYEIRFGYWDGDTITRGLPIQLEQIKRDQNPIREVDEPMLRLDGGTFGETALQSLFDQLWNLGLRPADIGTAGHLESTKTHLNDMRAIVAKQLDVTLK